MNMKIVELFDNWFQTGFDGGYSAQAQKLLPLDATQRVYGDPPWNVKARFR